MKTNYSKTFFCSVLFMMMCSLCLAVEQTKDTSKDHIKRSFYWMDLGVGVRGFEVINERTDSSSIASQFIDIGASGRWNLDGRSAFFLNLKLSFLRADKAEYDPEESSTGFDDEDDDAALGLKAGFDYGLRSDLLFNISLGLIQEFFPVFSARLAGNEIEEIMSVRTSIVPRIEFGVVKRFSKRSSVEFSYAQFISNQDPDLYVTGGQSLAVAWHRDSSKNRFYRVEGSMKEFDIASLIVRSNSLSFNMGYYF